MRTPQIEVSVCCKATPIEDTKENPRDHHDPIEIYRCSKCHKECEVEEVCELCNGTGVVDKDERDSDGNIARGVGSEPCMHTLKDEEDEHDE